MIRFKKLVILNALKHIPYIPAFNKLTNLGIHIFISSIYCCKTRNKFSSQKQTKNINFHALQIKCFSLRHAEDFVSSPIDSFKIYITWSPKIWFETSPIYYALKLPSCSTARNYKQRQFSNEKQSQLVIFQMEFLFMSMKRAGETKMI